MTVSSAEARRLLKDALQREAALRVEIGGDLRTAMENLAARRAQVDADEIALFDTAEFAGAGLPWVADALGMTRQGARRRQKALEAKRRKGLLPEPSPGIAAIVAAIVTPVPGKKEN